MNHNVSTAELKYFTWKNKQNNNKKQYFYGMTIVYGTVKAFHMKKNVCCNTTPHTKCTSTVMTPEDVKYMQYWLSDPWTDLEFAKSKKAVENREKWRKLVANSSMVPQQPSRLRERWWWWWWCAVTSVVTWEMQYMQFWLFHLFVLSDVHALVMILTFVLITTALYIYWLIRFV